MKQIPDELKADLPQSKWGKILGATPVVLAVVSTLLAGLASSEMTKAQYDRSLAAQLQSKAGDQWSFFQAKRLRGALQDNTLDVILSSAGRRAIERGALLAALTGTPAEAALKGSGSDAIFAALRDGSLPKPGARPDQDPNVHAALAALEAGKSDAELAVLLGKVDDKTLEDAARAARDYVAALDAATEPVGNAIEEIEEQMARASTDAALRRDFVAARLGYNARRYDAEARLNQSVASLYELQVRKANISAARHHRRSQRFFYGMLAAQTGVIISTLAIAARQRNLLWTIAAIAGFTAVAFAVYVYVFV